MYRHIRRLLALTLLTHGIGLAAAEPALTLAVHPYLPAEEVHARFRPLADYLAAELGRPVEVRVGGNYEQHVEAIGQDRVDIAFMGPAAYVTMLDRYGDKPILGRFEVGGNPRLYGVIATRSDSNLVSLKQLKNARFAFGDPQSTMSHLVPRFMLLQAGVPRGLPARHQFLGSHKNVALGVLAGDFDAGAMKQEVFDAFQGQGLRALARTPGVPDHLFVARSTLPPAEVARLRVALQGLGQRPGGQAILEGLHPGLTALVAARRDDYRELRRMVRAIEAQPQ